MSHAPVQRQCNGPALFKMKFAFCMGQVFCLDYASNSLAQIFKVDCVRLLFWPFFFKLVCVSSLACSGSCCDPRAQAREAEAGLSMPLQLAFRPGRTLCPLILGELAARKRL